MNPKPLPPIQGTFTLSGTIKAGGKALPDVEINIDRPTASRVTRTSLQGSYTTPPLKPGTCTVTPKLAGYMFDPPSKAVIIKTTDIKGVDFLGIPKVISKAEADKQEERDDIANDRATERRDAAEADADAEASAIAEGDAAEVSGTVKSEEETAAEMVATQKEIAPGLVPFCVISGHVRNDGKPVADIEVGFIAISEELPSEPPCLTTENGVYLSGLLLPGTYLVTPKSKGFTFDPTVRQVTILNADVRDVDFIAGVLP